MSEPTAQQEREIQEKEKCGTDADLNLAGFKYSTGVDLCGPVVNAGKVVEVVDINEEGVHGKVEEDKEEENCDQKRESECPWTVHEVKHDYTVWSELTREQKWKRGLLYVVKTILVFGFLYLFICSLDFLSRSFKLLGGKKAGEVFKRSDILNNPLAGLMIGVLVTVLVQSSSTSTSIIISMVAAEILTVKTAVPIIMGANIGTTVTNTIVAFMQVTNKNIFRRAFAGATVHDMFNIVAVAVLLPLEVVSGYLFHLSGVIVDSMHLNETLDFNKDLLKTITKPFTNMVVQVSSSDIKKIATGSKKASEATLLKFCCDKKDTKPETCCQKTLESLPDSLYNKHARTLFTEAQKSAVCQEVDRCVLKDYSTDDPKLQECVSTPWKTVTEPVQHDVNTLHCVRIGETALETECCYNELKSATFYKDFGSNATAVEQRALCVITNSTCFAGSDVYDTCMTSWGPGRTEVSHRESFSCKVWTKEVETDCIKQCDFLFRGAHESQGGPLSDEDVGGILLVLSLALLCACLLLMVRVLRSLLEGPISKLLKKFINANFPGYAAYFTDYLAILIGAGMTILVQSSSIFTSALTPLVGIGVIGLERMYPLTLGSNIGTTATGVLASLAQNVESIPRALQIALCHLLFNITGIAIFFPLPFFRPPIKAAKFLGNTTANYRWFAPVYLFIIFFLLPLTIFGLSTLGWEVQAGVLIPTGILIVVVMIINCIQARKPSYLPAKLRTWEFLPLPCRSLKPYDLLMKKLFFCKRCHVLHLHHLERPSFHR